MPENPYASDTVCWCPDDWREPFDKTRCPQHGGAAYESVRAKAYREGAAAGSTPARDGEGSDTPAAAIDRILLKLGLARRSTVIKAYVNAQNNPTHDPTGCGCALDMLNHFSALTGHDPLDVAIEAVREGAAAASAAAQEREGTARLVADHWRKAMLDAGDERMPARAAAHPLCMVLAALDGETRPEHLGITPESDEWHVLSAALLSEEPADG